MIIEEISRWDEIEQSISALRKRVVIDCGHVSVRRRLASEGREATLSLCLSDTSRLLGDSKERAVLAAAIAEQRWSAILPSEYLHRLSQDEFVQFRRRSPGHQHAVSDGMRKRRRLLRK
ncbi:hypothetical protein [Burkholderia ubonensis]|uniref:hypothetical protein n=1 Tax=Burkholderia ubonensis TaxID=101571 RepID=UPI000A94B91D|nr:hypothetical protein [Burkholderia ubonensis]